jgi:MtN3 and saliva related transmembrane protein
MDLAQIIGFAAGFGTTFAAMPDLIAMLKRRSSVGMNPRMAAITGTFQILRAIYRALIGSRNIIMWECDRGIDQLSYRWRIHVLSFAREARS